MNINIDGIVAGIKYGESILNAVNRLGLDSDTLRMKPLAAQIGGEVFNLNYTPFRNVSIHLLRYGEEEGKRVYERTLQFVFIMSVRKLFPNAKVYVRYSMGEGLYITIEKTPELTEGDVASIKAECSEIISRNIPLVRKGLISRRPCPYLRRTVRGIRPNC